MMYYMYLFKWFTIYTCLYIVLHVLVCMMYYMYLVEWCTIFTCLYDVPYSLVCMYENMFPTRVPEDADKSKIPHESVDEIIYLSNNVLI